MEEKKQKEYTGSVYVAVTGSENENGICRDSIENLILRPGDEPARMGRGTKGFEVRQQHLNNFIKSKHDFILFLDQDMVFPEFTLEQLRSHKLPYVSGFYTRRDYQPVAPVWFKPWAGSFPFEPWLDQIERGKLYKIGASGWGCMLVHRDVILDTRKLLKGEPEIIEDDLDIWAYDLHAILGAIKGLRALAKERPEEVNLYPALEAHLKTLEGEIKPLRADRGNVGSDIRFPFYAMHAGYQLHGDSTVCCQHMIEYPLGIDDYLLYTPEVRGKIQGNVLNAQKSERARLKAQKRGLYA